MKRRQGEKYNLTLLISPKYVCKSGHILKAYQASKNARALSLYLQVPWGRMSKRQSIGRPSTTLQSSELRVVRPIRDNFLSMSQILHGTNAY